MHRRSGFFSVGLVAIAAVLAAPTAVVAGEGDRVQRVEDWPRVDLTGYERLFIEDCEVTDPEASERKIQNLVQEVPKRLADYIEFAVDRQVFPEVERRGPEPGESGVIVRVELTKYKPGSQTARALMIGTSSARMDFTLELLDAQSGDVLQTIGEDRDFVWGGYHGMKSITLMEEKAGKEIAAYLSLCKGVSPDVVLARMKDIEAVGPPDVEHGTIYLMRPQGFVGAAARFRIGVDDTTVGESKRKRYHVIYVRPGEHEVWWGSDKKVKKKPVTVEAGKSYYFETMGMKQIPEAKGAKKLKQCKLAREIDLTGGE